MFQLNEYFFQLFYPEHRNPKENQAYHKAGIWNNKEVKKPYARAYDQRYRVYNGYFSQGISLELFHEKQS